MRLVIPELTWHQERRRLSDEQVHYCVKVNRLTSGAEIEVSDGSGKRALHRLENKDDEWWIERISAINEAGNIAPVTIYFGLPKGDKLDRVVRQLSELGIEELVLVEMERNVVVLDAKRAEKRLERLNRIAVEAARQSQRSNLLRIKGPVSLKTSIELASRHTHAYVCSPEADNAMPMMESGTSCGLFVGPEGGLSHSELKALSAGGIREIRFGATVLRTETAAVVAGTVALSRLGWL